MRTPVDVIVAGSRSIIFPAQTHRCLSEAFDKLLTPRLILSGGVAGPATHGLTWAEARGIPCRVYPAKWNTLGRYAGIARNLEMAEKAAALVAIWDGESRGTKHMIDTMKKRGAPVVVYLWDSDVDCTTILHNFPGYSHVRDGA